MPYALNWKDLLCCERERTKSETSPNDYRHDFENDYDRIVFSAPFRRLQDKAQVFPLERNDFVRTRLTHSIEVAALARSIGVSIAREMLKENRTDKEYATYIPVILEAAGLAHDIGNPPFGHYGETTLQNAFREWFDKNKSFELDFKEKEDFLNYEGNCQMFRILTHLQCVKDEYGLNLTYAMLATLMKYPFDSVEGNKNAKENGVYYKKFGYFNTEQEVALKALRLTGLKENDSTYRHPLAFVLEAADDIAYLPGDMEDAYKKKLISFDIIRDYFCTEKVSDESSKKICKKVEEIIKDDEKVYYSDEKKMQDIRIVIQGFMKEKVVEAFNDNYDDIMNKKFKKELLSVSGAQYIEKILRDISVKYIYKSSEIEKLELGGEQAIRYLVKRFMDDLGNDLFIDYQLNPESHKLSKSQERIYRVISDDFRKVFEKKVKEIKKGNLSQKDILNRIRYNICIMIADYISGMTDSYCTDLYRELLGVGHIFS